MTLLTERTLLRPFTLEDAPAAFIWFSDPEVMRFTPFGPDQDLRSTEQRINQYITAQGTRGFSKWIVLERESHTPIGDAGILWFEELQCFELGYRLRRDRWGQGLATEIALAWLARAHSLPFHQLSAFAHVDNFASHSVLKKSGFTQSRRAEVMGMDSLIFLRQV
ncbi:MAG: GNAT family N-acetyltransferase [Leptospirales bacterium]|nr:GNAT family N-acetyltransferase [Leptospirales bacterium]